MNTRDIAYDILKKIEYEDLFVNDILHNALRRMQFSDKRERAFLTRLVEGVTERKMSLDFLIDKFSTGKKRIKPDIRIILRMGIYQIRYMENVPDRAAISESVELARRNGYDGLSGYINAVLRKVSEVNSEGKLDSFLVSRMETRYSTPQWLCDFLMKAYGKDNAKLILEDQYSSHDTVVRVNLMKTTADELRQRFESVGVKVSGSVLPDARGITQETGGSDELTDELIDESSYIDDKEDRTNLNDRILRISDYDVITRLPGYKEGHFIVQDETSVYTVSRAGIRPGDLIIDMCASPGGKSLLAYELSCSDERAGLVISRDISRDKIDRIRENAERLGILVSEPDTGNKNSNTSEMPAGIKLEIKDATEPDQEFAGRRLEDKADVVIVDVPCSGLGIIGRKNDIKYHTSPEAMQELAEQGLKILTNASSLIRPGGRICFSTCTINPGENGEVVRKFLGTPQGAAFSIVEERTFLQGIDGSDGFYYCILS